MAAPAPHAASGPRVLCVIDTIGLGGGAEQLLVSLLPALRARDVAIELAALFPWLPDLGVELERAGVTVHRLNATGPLAKTVAAWRLRRLVARGRYDVAWSHLRYANILTQIALVGFRGVRRVATFHSEGYSGAGRLSPRARLSTRVEKAALDPVFKVAVSGAVAADYERFFGWRGLAVAHNGVDLREAPPPLTPDMRASLRAAYGVAPDAFLLVAPGRYVPKKGHAILFAALDQLAATRDLRPHLLAFGVGPLRDDLAQAARRFEGRVRIHDPIPHAELFALMRAADGVVLPSLREPFGIAAAEAMMLEAPLILTRVDGFVELAGDADAALMVPPGDAPALADAIHALASDPAAARARAIRARERVARDFSIDAAADRWNALLRLAAA